MKFKNIYSGCFFFIFNQGTKFLYGTQNGVGQGIENYKTVCFKTEYNRKHVSVVIKTTN